MGSQMRKMLSAGGKMPAVVGVIAAVAVIAGVFAFNQSRDSVQTDAELTTDAERITKVELTSTDGNIFEVPSGLEQDLTLQANPETVHAKAQIVTEEASLLPYEYYTLSVALSVGDGYVLGKKTKVSLDGYSAELTEQSDGSYVLETTVLSLPEEKWTDELCAVTEYLDGRNAATIGTAEVSAQLPVELVVYNQDKTEKQIFAPGKVPLFMVPAFLGNGDLISLSDGKKVEILSEYGQNNFGSVIGTWYKVCFKNKIGYLPKGFLRKIEIEDAEKTVESNKEAGTVSVAAFAGNKKENTGSTGENDGSSESSQMPGTPGSSNNDSKKPDTSGDNANPPKNIYYTVSFAVGDGMDAGKIILPQQCTYEQNTTLSELPKATMVEGVFLGWYYDSAMTRGVTSEDILQGNLTLYASMTDTKGLSEKETLTFATANGVDVSYTFQVSAESEQRLKEALSIREVSNNNADMSYQVTGSAPLFTVSAQWAEGGTYKVMLAEDAEDMIFVLDGQEQETSVRVLDIMTGKAETQGLRLDEDVKYVTSDEISELTGDGLESMFQVSASDVELTADTEKKSGTFRSSRTFAVGDTVAIYTGTRPDKRVKAEDEEVAYVVITDVKDGVYSYTTAEVENVIFLPDVLPMSTTADMDGDADNNAVTVSAEELDYSADIYAACGLDSQTVAETGDFLAFYVGELENVSGISTYARITGITENADGQTYTITYESVTQDEIYHSLDAYSVAEQDVELTQAQREQMEGVLEQRALESGFVDEAAQYLTALALGTEKFTELTGENGADYEIMMTDLASDDPGIALAAENTKRAIVTSKEVVPSISTQLVHYDGRSGLRATLKVRFKLVIPSGEEKDTLTISMEADFEQELFLTLNLSGKAVWETAWVFPYIADYQANVNLDVGTFTNVSIEATARTDANEEEALGDKLYDMLAGEEEELSEDESNELANKYAEMMSEVDDTWITLFDESLLDFSGSVDPLHLMEYSMEVKCVIKTTLYASLGMDFESAAAKRYNFCLRMFEGRCTTETVDLVSPYYDFSCYAMGTAGLRAGFELEIAVGLISTKLDKVGVVAEVGDYAQVWGYFFYKVHDSSETGKQTKYGGQVYFEVGLYLEVSGLFQLMESDKLSFNPTIYENEWPLLTVGAEEVVYDFAYGKTSPDLEYKMAGVKSITFPSFMFDMYYMDMKDGKTHRKNYDDERESHYNIRFTNQAFRYDPKTNQITVNTNGVKETTEMILTWTDETQAFSSEPVVRTVKIEWSDPENMRYIAFDSRGGGYLNTIIGKSGDTIAWQADPVKEGYLFKGWYETDDSSYDYRQVTKIPNFANGVKGVTLLARWQPAPNGYTVEKYYQELNGRYTRADEECFAVNEARDNADIVTGLLAQFHETEADRTGYILNENKSTVAEVIRADGSTCVKLYYDLLTYPVSFTYGVLTDNTAATGTVTYTARYGSALKMPLLSLPGYTMTGFAPAPESESLESLGNDTLLVTGKAVYEAQWKEKDDTAYRVEHYVDKADGSGNELLTTEEYTGTTNTGITLDDKKLSDGKYGWLEYESATCSGAPVTEDRPALIAGDGKTVLKLYYKRKTYDLILMDQEEEIRREAVRYGASVTALKVPEKNGYEFEDWYTDSKLETLFDAENFTMPDREVTLYAKWAPAERRYTVEHYRQNTDLSTYSKMSEADQTLTAKTGTVLTLSDFVSDVCAETGKFAYVYAKVGEDTMDTYTIPAEGAVTIKLYYDRVQHNVTWDAANGTEPVVTQALYGCIISAPEQIPEKTGYTFLRWLNSAGSEAGYTVMGTEDMTFTARYTAMGDIVAAFQPNGGVLVNEDDAERTVTFDSAYGTLPEVAERTGYTFVGWFTQAEGGVQVTAETLVKQAQSHTIYAHWTPKTYTYNLRLLEEGTVDDTAVFPDGTGETEGLIHTFGTKNTFPTPTREGWDFAGWLASDAAEGTAACMEIGAEELWDGIRTYVAQWSRFSVTYTYVNGGMGVPADGWLGYPFPNVGVTLPQYYTKSQGLSVSSDYFFKKYTSDEYAAQENLTDTMYGWLSEIYRKGYGFVLPGPDGKPLPPRYKGFAIDGWYYDGKIYTAASEGQQIQIIEPGANAGDVTLEFRYRLLYADPAISYDLREGAWPEGVEAPPTSHTEEGAVVNVPNPVKTGWTFAGWTVERGGAALEGLYTDYAIPADSNAYKLTANWRKTVELYYKSNGEAFSTAAISNTDKLPGKLGTGAYQSMVSQWYYMDGGEYVPLPGEYDPYQKSSPTLNAAPTAATLYDAGYTKLYADVMERSGDEYVVDSVTDLYFMKRCVNDGGMDIYLTEDPLPGRPPILDLNKRFSKENYRMNVWLTLAEAWTDTIGNQSREFTGNFVGNGGLIFKNIQAPVFDSVYGKISIRMTLEDATEHSTFPLLARNVKDGAEIVEAFVDLGTFCYGSGAGGELGLLVGWNEGKIRNCSVDGTLYLKGAALSSLSVIASQNFIGASQDTGDKYTTIGGADCINGCRVNLTCTVDGARIDNFAGVVWNNAGAVKNCSGTITIGITNGGSVGASSPVSIIRDEMFGDLLESNNTITIQ